MFRDGYGLGAGAGAGLSVELLQQTIANLQTANSNTNAITASVGEAKEGISNQLGDINQAIANGFANISAQACQARYDAAIANCQQTNLLVSTINSGVQSIKDQMTETTIANLERALAVAENGGPIVRSGAFVPVNPCSDSARMTNIENTIVQIGSALSAVQTAIANK